MDIIGYKCRLTEQSTDFLTYEKEVIAVDQSGKTLHIHSAPDR